MFRVLLLIYGELARKVLNCFIVFEMIRAQKWIQRPADGYLSDESNRCFVLIGELNASRLVLFICGITKHKRRNDSIIELYFRLNHAAWFVYCQSTRRLCFRRYNTTDTHTNTQKYHAAKWKWPKAVSSSSGQKRGKMRMQYFKREAQRTVGFIDSSSRSAVPQFKLINSIYDNHNWWQLCQLKVLYSGMKINSFFNASFNLSCSSRPPSRIKNQYDRRKVKNAT